MAGVLNLLKLAFKQGRKPSTDDLSSLTSTVEQLKINRAKLAKYHRVCGFSLINQVAPTYLCTLVQQMQIGLMADSRFPFKALGLVHIANEVTQYRPITPNETLRLTCSFVSIKPHDKGRTFDVVGEAYVAGALVWRCTSTYLSRSKTNPSTEKPAHETKENTLLADVSLAQTWRIPADIGRRYAAVSGDFNPIHLANFSAKLFGFKRAIAHGMWSKAHALASVPRLPDAFTTHVQFKLPVFIPTEVQFRAEVDKNGYASTFQMHDKDGIKPHLVGTIGAVVG